MTFTMIGWLIIWKVLTTEQPLKICLNCKSHENFTEKFRVRIKKKYWRILSSCLYNLGINSIVSYIVLFSKDKNTHNLLEILLNV